MTVGFGEATRAREAAVGKIRPSRTLADLVVDPRVNGVDGIVAGTVVDVRKDIGAVPLSEAEALRRGVDHAIVEFDDPLRQRNL